MGTDALSCDKVPSASRNLMAPKKSWYITILISVLLVLVRPTLFYSIESVDIASPCCDFSRYEAKRMNVR